MSLPYIYRLKLEYVLESFTKQWKYTKYIFHILSLQQMYKDITLHITTILLVLFDFLVHISMREALNIIWKSALQIWIYKNRSIFIKIGKVYQQLTQNHAEFSSFDTFKQMNADQSYYSELVPNEMKW